MNGDAVSRHLSKVYLSLCFARTVKFTLILASYTRLNVDGDHDVLSVKRPAGST